MRFLELTCGLAVLGFFACGGSDFSSNGGGAGGHGNGGVANGGSSVGTGGTVGNGGAGGAASGGTAAGGTAAGGSGTGGATTAPAWCADRATALFCEDFDSYTSVDPFLNGWSNFSQINGSFSFTTGVSAPNALRVRTSATQDVNAVVMKTFTPSVTPSKIRLDFALDIKESSGMGGLFPGAAIAAIILGTDPTADGAVALEIAGSNLETVWYKAPPDGGNWLSSIGSQTIGALPTLNQWAGRFAMELQYATAADAARTACVQFYIAGIAQGPCAALAAGMESPPSTFSIALGIRSLNATTGTIEILYDNVVVTAN